MSSTFFGIEIGKTSLIAHQQALNITGHNLANLNTEGYTRQRLVMTAGPAITNASVPGHIGSGVVMKSIERLRNNFVDKQFRHESSQQGEWSELSDIMLQTEKVFLEPSDNGINKLLTNFWNAWQTLSTTPENDGARTNLKEEAATLSTAIRFTYDKVLGIQKDSNTSLSNQVDTINDIAQQIAKYNAIITEAVIVGEQPNDLKDKRDLLLDELSEIVDIHVTEAQDGSMRINISGKTLVDRGHVTELFVQQDSLNSNFFMIKWADTGFNLDFSSGKLQGLLNARDQLLPDVIGELNGLAIGLVDRINEIHSSGFGMDETTDVPFFTPFDSESVRATKRSTADVVSGPNSLDTAQTLNTAGFDGPVGTGTITINGQRFAITATTTVDEFIRQVNQNRNANVTLSYDDIADRFTLSSDSDGSAGKINLKDPDDTGIFTQMKIDSFAVIFGTGDIYKITGDELASGEYGVTNLELPINGDPLQSTNENLERNPVSPAIGSFMINGVEIGYNADVDRLQDIVRKINNSDSGVVADIDTRSRLVLRATPETDYKIESLEDIRGNFLKKIGMIDIYASPRNIIGETVSTPREHAASYISVNEDILNNIRLIAADQGHTVDSDNRGQDDNPRQYRPNGPGDGNNSLRIAQLANELTSNHNRSTFSNQYDTSISSLGARTREAKRMNTNQLLLKNQFLQKREAISGINIDEEMANILRFQHGYNAAAKLIATMDQMLEKLINGL